MSQQSASPPGVAPYTTKSKRRRSAGATPGAVVRASHVTCTHALKVVTIADMVEPARPRARRLYEILSGLLKGRPLAMLRFIPEQNGFELWRQLQAVYAPRTRARRLALLSKPVRGQVEKVCEKKKRSDEVVT